MGWKTSHPQETKTAPSSFPSPLQNSQTPSLLLSPFPNSNPGIVQLSIRPTVTSFFLISSCLANCTGFPCRLKPPNLCSHSWHFPCPLLLWLYSNVTVRRAWTDPHIQSTMDSYPAIFLLFALTPEIASVSYLCILFAYMPPWLVDSRRNSRRISFTHPCILQAQ